MPVLRWFYSRCIISCKGYVPQEAGVVGWCVLLIWFIVGKRPTALAVGAGGGCLDIFSLVYHFSLLSLSGRRPDIDRNTV